MTSYPYEPQPTDAFAEDAHAHDPDRVVLAEDDDLGQVRAADVRNDAEVGNDETTWLTSGTGVSEPGEPSAPGVSEPGVSGRLGQQWHDIQAMFVDDPQGSVQRAAQAADAAIRTLVDFLRQQQAALIPADRDGNPGDTEQLRAALRSYRNFCQRAAELEAQLPRAGATRR